MGQGFRIFPIESARQTKACSDNSRENVLKYSQRKKADRKKSKPTTFACSCVFLLSPDSKQLVRTALPFLGGNTWN